MRWPSRSYWQEIYRAGKSLFCLEGLTDVKHHHCMVAVLSGSYDGEKLTVM